MSMSQNSYSNLLNVLDEIIAENEVTAIQVYVETEHGKGYALDCSPTDVPYDLPLQRVFH